MEPPQCLCRRKLRRSATRGTHSKTSGDHHLPGILHRQNNPGPTGMDTASAHTHARRVPRNTRCTPCEPTSCATVSRTKVRAIRVGPSSTSQSALFPQLPPGSGETSAIEGGPPLFRGLDCSRNMKPAPSGAGSSCALDSIALPHLHIYRTYIRRLTSNNSIRILFCSESVCVGGNFEGFCGITDTFLLFTHLLKYILNFNPFSFEYCFILFPL